MIVILKIGLNYLKGKETTKYGITKPSAPQLPTFRNVTKRIQILLYKAIKHPPFLPSSTKPSPSPRRWNAPSSNKKVAKAS